MFFGGKIENVVYWLFYYVCGDFGNFFFFFVIVEFLYILKIFNLKFWIFFLILKCIKKNWIYDIFVCLYIVLFIYIYMYLESCFFFWNKFVCYCCFLEYIWCVVRLGKGNIDYNECYIWEYMYIYFGIKVLWLLDCELVF